MWRTNRLAQCTVLLVVLFSQTTWCRSQVVSQSSQFSFQSQNQQSQMSSSSSSSSSSIGGVVQSQMSSSIGGGGGGGVKMSTNIGGGGVGQSFSSGSSLSENVDKNGVLHGMCSYIDSTGSLIKMKYEEKAGKLDLLETVPKDQEDAAEQLKLCRAAAAHGAAKTQQSIREGQRQMAKVEAELFAQHEQMQRELQKQQEELLNEAFDDPLPELEFSDILE